MAAEPASGSGRAVPTPFLTKTYQLVDDPAVDDVISWNHDGSGFVVWRPAELARDLLPKHFKHNNFSSFVRQLNTYGFRKTVPDRWEFANDCFRRGEKRLLCEIHRRKPTPPATGTTAPAAAPMVLPVGSPVHSGEEQAVTSDSSPGPVSGDENERLRRENARLARELGRMKKLCNSILLLVSKYAAKASETTAVDCCGESVEAAPPPRAIRDLVSTTTSCHGAPAAVEGGLEDHKTSTRLFGVSIGRKRTRGDGEEPFRPAAR